jgi:hypothetical protein
MNEYLAKLHRLESATHASGPKKSIIEAPTKPDKTSSVSFVGDRSVGFSGVEPRQRETNAAPDMQNVISSGIEKHHSSDRQNRQNLVAAPFPYSEALDQLERECPEYVEGDRWRRCLIDAQRFLAEWGEKAESLGWTSRDLFGLAPVPDKPATNFRRLSRYDLTGLIWLLRGDPVVALTETTAAIRHATGNITTYRRFHKPAFGPLGDSLDDMGATLS